MYPPKNEKASHSTNIQPNHLPLPPRYETFTVIQKTPIVLNIDIQFIIYALGFTQWPIVLSFWVRVRRPKARRSTARRSTVRKTKSQNIDKQKERNPKYRMNMFPKISNKQGAWCSMKYCTMPVYFFENWVQDSCHTQYFDDTVFKKQNLFSFK